MSFYLAPRRFARVWEMNRQGFPRCGTLEEQQAIRDVFDRYVEFDNPLDRVLMALDKNVNDSGRHFLQFDVVHDTAYAGRVWGRATSIWIQVFCDPTNPPSEEDWSIVVTHELGHVVGWRLFSPADTSEAWAAQFQNWAMNGQPLDSPVWSRLEPVVPETVVLQDE